MEIKGTVRFTGATECQIKWGGNDDPNPHLKVGQLYDVIEIEVHSQHTKIRLKGFESMKFNSVSFEWLDEKPLEEALAAYRDRYL